MPQKINNPLKTLTLILPLILLTHTQKQIFIDTTTEGQQVAINNLFTGINDGYYIDIGAYDPIYQSNTFNLYSRGWNGINIDANYNRLQKFIYQRNGDMNLHLAVSGKEDMVVLYESADGALSTVSQKVKSKAQEAYVSTSKVHSLQLGEICKRYFLMRPHFMNMAVQGLGYQAFQSNNWDDPKCSPEVISVTVDQILSPSDTPKKPQQILQKYGYIKADDIPNLSYGNSRQLYIHQDYLAAYWTRVQQNTAKFYTKKQIHNLFMILHDLQDTTKINIISNKITGPHMHNTNSYSQQQYSPAQSGMYVHVSKDDEELELLNINRLSNMVSEKKNRPIVVLNFNPHKSFVMYPDKRIFTVEVKTQYYSFTFFNFTARTGEKVQVYILDQFYRPLTKPKFIVTEQNIQSQEQIKKIASIPNTNTNKNLRPNNNDNINTNTNTNSNLNPNLTPSKPSTDNPNPTQNLNTNTNVNSNINSNQNINHDSTAKSTLNQNQNRNKDEKSKNNPTYYYLDPNTNTKPNQNSQTTPVVSNNNANTNINTNSNPITLRQNPTLNPTSNPNPNPYPSTSTSTSTFTSSTSTSTSIPQPQPQPQSQSQPSQPNINNQPIIYTKLGQYPPISPKTTQVIDFTKHTIYPRTQQLTYDFKQEIVPVTAVFAGSDRLDLMTKTLNSFFAKNTYPIREIYAINDGLLSPQFFAMTKKFRNITWIITNRKVGQLFALDIAYAYIKTEYFFHSEDDWQYVKTNFIQDSIPILQTKPWIIIVFLGSFWGTVAQEVSAQSDMFTGLTLNPGLRRITQYRMIPSYSEYTNFRSWGVGAGNDQYCLAKYYVEAGYRTFTLGQTYVQHIGINRGSRRFQFQGGKLMC